MGTFDNWVAEQHAEAARRGWPIAKLADALGTSPARVMARIHAGEIRTTQFGTTAVVTFEELARIGLI